MKIRIDVDIKPEEMRKLLGLPDVAALQEEMIQAVRDKISQGADALESIAALNRQLLPESLQSASAIQKMLSKGLGAFTDRITREAEEEPEADAKSKAKPKSKPAARKPKTSK